MYFIYTLWLTGISLSIFIYWRCSNILTRLFWRGCCWPFMLESKMNCQHGSVKPLADWTAMLIHKGNGLGEEACQPSHPGVNKQESSELLYMEITKRSYRVLTDYFTENNLNNLKNGLLSSCIIVRYRWALLLGLEFGCLAARVNFHFCLALLAQLRPHTSCMLEVFRG